MEKESANQPLNDVKYLSRKERTELRRFLRQMEMEDDGEVLEAPTTPSLQEESDSEERALQLDLASEVGAYSPHRLFSGAADPCGDQETAAVMDVDRTSVSTNGVSGKRHAPVTAFEEASRDQSSFKSTAALHSSAPVSGREEGAGAAGSLGHSASRQARAQGSAEHPPSQPH